jgi:hypothetical protein
VVRLIMGVTMVYYGWPKVRDPKKNGAELEASRFKPGALWGTLVIRRQRPRALQRRLASLASPLHYNEAGMSPTPVPIVPDLLPPDAHWRFSGIRPAADV